MRYLLYILLCLLIPFGISAQKLDNTQVRDLLNQFKADPKGPYKDIRWFCKDGTTRPPQERCPEPGSQRARYKDEVISLAKNNQVYLGQILTTTDYNDFWDKNNYHSRLKQYQLEKYLIRSDNGWILRKAQYYRGAFQAEDEETWGVEFFKWLLSDDNPLTQNFYLIRQAAKDIPHQGDDSKTQLVRSLSKEISDSVPSFLNIRVKIHGQPESSDITAVKKYKEDNKKNLSSTQLVKIDELVRAMEIVYQPADFKSFDKYLKKIPSSTEPGKSIQSFLNQYKNKSGKEKVIEISKLLFLVRQQITNVKESAGRLALIDISIKLEEILFREIKSWNIVNLHDIIEKNYYLGLASTGCGYLEMWEWEKIQPHLAIPDNPSITLGDLSEIMDNSRRLVEWSAGMSRGVYKDVLDLFGGFEPMAYGFNDDRIRSSILLYLGNSVSELGDCIAREAELSNKVLDISGQSQIRGINPGYALGELVVLNEVTEKTEISGDKIYVFNHPPADLKPIAGIATVTEGNMVSHVQLLARNLGIPNAVISAQNLEQLKEFSGEKMFYAVSNKGTVIMKRADKMNPEEKKLFETKKRNEEKITVPVDRMNLKQSTIVNLRDVNASHSGILCGPKAANLGQLKLMFPTQVVEGFVIPFGIFRQHMEQKIPGKNTSYWEYLNSIFDRANQMGVKNIPEKEIEKFMLAELETLRNEIKTMPLKQEFLLDLQKSFSNILGKNIGEVPVFLRSDTNMEDLQDFTGAGLNLTLFNVVEKEKIIQGIKDVWASPYSERSYKWRQRYLLNPENVYPSILIIPSVDVEYSGVLITKGIINNQEDDLTIAFSRGAGGAVEGQAAESYLLKSNGENVLISPSREAFYNRLPVKGGTEKLAAPFEKEILSNKNLLQVRDFATKVIKQMPESSKSKSSGPYDVELGFKDNAIWLFQIRPFVENKNALKTEYLKSISPEIPTDKLINLNTTL
ncbi:MAG: hypothetical protein K9G76_00750 [Bacteroidales bacterium]|nr:hypothetical protein [Bacteroidales bacterium]MCF8402642.1 hypothetical protein [Bacteroidales bacterium]